MSQRNMEALSMQAVMELGKNKFQLHLKLGRVCEIQQRFLQVHHQEKKTIYTVGVLLNGLNNLLIGVH